jgi:FAD/FMN-containing dehydrogenase
MSVPLIARLKKDIRGDVSVSTKDLATYSRDTSIFTRTPEVVVFPKDAEDVASLVRTVRTAKQEGMPVSVTARSAGTCMSGGSLTTSVVAVFTKYINKVVEVRNGYAVVEPGCYYRDFEKATLADGNQILPSYPASREIAALGGIVNNNSGGERTLEYGKTSDYIEEVEVVLDDGSIVTFGPLTASQVEEKKRLKTREGGIYRELAALLELHRDEIAAAKPKVSKNSAGYALWDVMDPKTGVMNIAKLICGAQGTLALTTKFKLRLVRQQEHRAMLVIFLTDLKNLPEIVRTVLPFNPESFESYDDHTFSLAVRFLPQMLSQMGFIPAIRLGLSFIPEVFMVLRGGVPKLVLMAEFSEDTAEQALFAAKKAHDALKPLELTMSIKRNEQEAQKYWKVRRESFSLLRKSVRGMYAAPFIDDFVVSPDCYPEFLPKLDALLAEYKDKFVYTIAGHIGNGNFHIIPLMDLSKKETRDVVLELAPRVYDLVIEYGGTTTGEHNDGIIRTPYLPQLFGEKIVALFEETKRIFDPLDIFNPGKKVHGTFADIERDMLRTK